MITIVQSRAPGGLYLVGQAVRVSWSPQKSHDSTTLANCDLVCRNRAGRECVMKA